MICIRLVVSQEDNDEDDVAMVVEITLATVEAGVELVVLSFTVTIQLIVMPSVVEFSEWKSSNDVIMPIQYFL